VDAPGTQRRSARKLPNDRPTRPPCTAAHSIHIDTISIISTMNHLDTDIEDYPDDDETYIDGDEYDGPPDHRWRPVAAIAGVVLVLAVIATIVIVNGGDSASTTATVVPAPSRTVIATPRPTAPTAAPTTSLPPETVTTLPPHASTPAHPPDTAGPGAAPATPPPTAGPSPPPTVNPRTVVYTVTGTKQLLDLVTVIYTDAQGLPHTDFNVSLPWSKTVVLNPGVQTKSVVATSLYGQLNCAIVNAEGQTIVASTNHTMIATCTQ
jgi:hypothetical protein